MVIFFFPANSSNFISNGVFKEEKKKGERNQKQIMHGKYFLEFV